MSELSTQLKTYGWTVENGLSALVKIIGKFVREGNELNYRTHCSPGKF